MKVIYSFLFFCFCLNTYAEEIVSTANKRINMINSTKIETKTFEEAPVSELERQYLNEVLKNGHDNKEKIVDIVETGVRNNDRKIILLKANLIKYGIVYTKDTDLAKNTYLKAVRLGETEALFSLGLLFLEENEIESSAEYFKQYYEINKAKQTEYIIGKLYYDHNEKQTAKGWLLRSSQHGSNKASHLLGVIYLEENNIKQAKKYLFMAANNGNPHSIELIEKNNKQLKLNTKDKIEKKRITEENSYQQDN